ncbi:hypothetical protein H6G41_14280 [Tolypothrix sp. FACHB-123]|uniref:RHS repeat-associated core domain-containing protein n=1 Tax=Tolypothrix sp. FACHB-123 TaxID=2692868 RepID=UPI0016825BC6|nr:RHS repeat-associated core domain-containing protein [Tolypothrix sp. FACHB-123]MBD2355773.1 hypothetical protein [Tolypothrix sp. FACHB-123]
MTNNNSPVTYNYVSPGVINIKDANGSTTQIRFTSTGQVQSIQDPLNRVTQFSYDANDYLSQITAPGNSISKFSYDAQGRLLSQTDPLNQKVSFTYTGNLDSPTTVTDQKGQVTQYSYNTYGELSGITHANGTSETFSYDLSGNLAQAKERSGDTFQYTYDSQGKVTRKTFDDGTFESYTYNTNGKISAITKGSDTISFDYDTENRLTKITYPNGRWLQYSYDSEGKRTKMVDQSGFTVNYSYDADDRLTGLTNATGASLITYTYDAVGRLSRETNGNGTYTTYSYDAANQLTDISNYAVNGTVNSYFRYTYDSLGRQTSVTTAEGKTTYEYDASGQLTRAFLDYTNASLTDQDLRYTYDAAGNRISSTVNGVTTNYTANNLNQYTQVGSAIYTYDADGNLIKVVDGTQTWTYVYNDENRLISGTTPQGTFAYEYDALGNRTAVVFNGQRTEYLVDPIGLGDIVGEYNGSGGLIANYTHGIGLVGRFGSGGVANYYDFDAIGSTVGLTGASGSYVNRYSYRPFGEAITKTEGVANPFEYIGQWGVMDDASGLDYMRARYYSPAFGRFMNPDPLGQAGGLNLYAYSLNDPVNFLDPLGLQQNTNNRGGFDFARGIRDRQTAIENLDPAAYNDAGRRIQDSSSRFIQELPNPGSRSPLTGLRNIKDLIDGGGLTPGGDTSGGTSGSGGTEGAADAWGGAKNAISPLVLDLDNDGIELISLQNSTAFFDLDADGFAERTGWVKPDDGILALDKNNNYQIDDITELFGNATTDGFIILKQLDSNNDNIINASDAQFANLRIWRDRDGDGFSDLGELRSLNDWGIKSINLNYQTVNLTNEGNRISSTSTYTLANGTTREIVDVWFTLDQLTSYYTKDYQLKTETLFLPILKGYGNLPNLYIAMSKDSTLLSMMRDLVLLDTSNYEQFYSQFLTQVEALFYRWAGVQNVAVNSRGGGIDGRKLAFLETFFGDSFLQYGSNPNPGPQASRILQGIWNDLFRELTGRLLVQGSLRNFFPHTTYNLANDSLESSTDLNTVLNSLVANAPTNGDQAIIYWSFVIAGLDAYENRFGLTQTEYDQKINQALASSQLSGYLNALRQPNVFSITNDVIGGTSGNDIINGGLGNDRINGGNGDDVISGSSGDDDLDGGFGNDKISGNDGNDVIRGGLGIDTLDGGSGNDTVNLDLSGQTINLTITNPSGGINLPGIVTATNFENFTITTGSGNDQIVQAALIGGVVYRSNDTFNGGAGNDTLNPGLGVSDRADGGTGDDLLILDYSIDDVGNGMIFSSNPVTEESTGSAGRTSTTGNWIDSISFSGINRFQITGTSKNDTITTGAGNDTINGGAGNDTINGGLGNDRINGGDGNDTITVSAGNDTVDGGLGSDRLILDLSTETTGRTFGLINGDLTIPGVVTATNFEEFTITTGSGNDTINQPTTVNSAVYRRNDIFNTGAGNDTINLGLGTNDRADGGTGDDLLIVDYSVDDVGQQMNFSAYSNSNGESAGSAYRFPATASNYLDNISFSNINRFQVTGTSKNDNITTGAGNDTILGGAGNDSINGGAGNDNINGGIGNDTILGGAGNDTINGGDDNDSINGGAGNDSINGGNGNDTIVGGGGTDIVDGGAGIDRLILDLSSQTSNQSIGLLGSNLTLGGVTATNFEEFTITTGSGNDTINQPTTVNSAVYRRNDIFNTGAGNDTINLGLGTNDRVDGGTGNDLLIVDYSVDDVGREMYLNVSSSNGESFGSAYRFQATTSTYLDNIYFNNINRFQVTGTSKNDNITTGVGNDTINGGAGNDSINGGAGNDSINGGAGNDSINGGAGNDRINGGDGNDTIVGGGGTDIIDGGAGIDRLILNLSSQSSNQTLGFLGSNFTLGGVTATNFEEFTITTGSGNDTINQPTTVDSAIYRGNQTFNTGAGNDTINLGLGTDDRADGGTGNDLLIVDYSVDDVGQQMYLNASGSNGESFGSAYRYQAATSSFLDYISFSNINRFQVTGTSKNDNITTGVGNDSINGGAGNDSINGGAGNDSINGGDGNDSINGGTGNDSINGGDGNDTIVGSGGTDIIDGGVGIDRLILDLSSQTSNQTLGFLGSNFTLGGVTATNFEEFTITTGAGNDSINQPTTVDSAIYRRNDTFNTGAGNDTINLGLGTDDRADGGTGDDLLIVDYSVDDVGQQMNFSASSSNGESSGSAYRYQAATSSYLDNISFSNINRFQVTGTSKNDNITTGAGNDTILGGAGNDYINGGAGDDTILGGAGNDNINGGLGNDSINGDDGNDTINGGGGTDIIDGGAGIDRLILDLSSQTSNQTLSLPSSNFTLGGVTATNFEEFTITTGSGNDTINQPTTVDSAIYRRNETFNTGAGNDTINLGLGTDDRADGGTGDDLLIVDYSVDDVGQQMNFSASSSNGESSGSAYRFSATASSYLDYIYFNNINRFQVTGTSKNDSINTSVGNDTVNGGAGNDYINAGAGDDTILGGADNDNINGGLGNDSINGGDGNDYINGGGGTDIVDGGAGIDRLILDLSSQTSNQTIGILGSNLTLGGVTATNFEEFTITTGSGNDTINQPTTVNSAIYRRNETFNTGAGNDTINLGLGTTDQADGGSGDDLLIVDYSVDDVGREMNFYAYENNGESSGVAQRYQAASSNFLDYISFYNINRFQVTGTSKNDIITTGAGNDTVNGGAGNDRINGGAGDDILVGGLGNDTLTGSSGADKFTVNAANQGIDVITDFLSSQGDKIYVSASGFGGGLVAGATITSEQFVLGTAAGDVSDRFIYNSTTGNLLFDIDGTGSLAATQIAVLSSKPALSYSDILVIA